MRNYTKERWKEQVDGAPVGGLVPGATPRHIIEWGPGVHVTLRGIAYLGTADGQGRPVDRGRSRHRLHRAGSP